LEKTSGREVILSVDTPSIPIVAQDSCVRNVWTVVGGGLVVLAWAI
jgi:hypothetical protein